MRMTRRSLLQHGGLIAGTTGLTAFNLLGQEGRPDPFSDLKSMTAGIKPFETSDYESRLEKARDLMAARKFDLFVLNGGTSLEYFGGLRWGLSERMFAMLIPVRGEIAWICPKFEEGRIREVVRFGKDIRTWEEDQNPYLIVKQVLQDRKLSGGTIAVEPTVREFVADGIRKACTPVRVVNGEEISQGCRMIKSQKELEIMTVACNVTKKAFDAAFRTLREGMSETELSRNIATATGRLGASGGASVSFGPASASPHGSLVARSLTPGDVVLVDGGCRVQGLNSDVTRTVVFGKPSEKIQRVWDIVKKAQDAALKAARPGVPCGEVDSAARKIIVEAGFGPDYRYFTHRLGHGIGLDGHEYPYLVRGNKLPLAPGMTFSDEPGIYIPGEFGLRIEDTMFIAADGAHYFGEPVLALAAYA